MKILHTLSQLPQKTGSGVYFTNLVKMFQEFPIENMVMYATQTPYQIEWLSIPEAVVRYKTLEAPYPIPGMSDIMPYEHSVFHQMSLMQQKQYRQRLKKILEEIKSNFAPDVIIAHHLFILTDVVREVFSDCLVIGICHGTDLRQIKKHPMFLSHLTHLPMLDKVWTVSAHDVDEVKELFDIHSKSVVRMGGAFDQNIFSPPITSHKNVHPMVMYAGKITSSKGVFELVQTLPLLNKVFPGVEIHIVGNATEKDKEIIRALSEGSEQIHVYNAKDQQEMAESLKASDVFVLPSYYEALGLSAIEALACGKYVVASDIEGLQTQLGEKVNRSGVIEYVKKPTLHHLDQPVVSEIPDYVSRLAFAIIRQIKRQQAGDMPEEILQNVRQHSWEMLAKRMFDDIFLMKIDEK